MSQAQMIAQAMSDDERNLIQRAQSGDVDAFERLVAPHQPALYRLALATAGNPDDAEDSLQETLVHAFRNIRTFRGDAAFSTWLHRIALNCTRNWLRAQARAASSRVAERLGQLGSPPAPDPCQEVEDEDLRLALSHALARLPNHYREALLLHYHAEMPYAQIAEVLHLPIGTVRSRLAQARMLLLRRLKHAGYASETRRTEP